MYKALLVLCAMLPIASPAQADTLVRNINGIQVGADGKIERFRYLIIDDTGRVSAVLTGEPPPIAFDRTIDGKGRTLLPGLIDAHGHVIGLGTAVLQLDLSGTRSLAELQQRLRAYASANPDAPWLLGRGWNQELWPDKRMPTAADLDAIVSDRPVWLQRVDGHASVANSAALKAAGITAATKSPAGGKIELDSSGKPTGLFIDAAAGLVDKVVPPPTDKQRDRALIEAQQMLLENGITAVADMGTSVADWQTMQRAVAADRLNIRIMSYAAGLEPLDVIKKPTGWLAGDRLNLVGLKLYTDGALGSRGAWLKRPYADQPDTTGLRFLSDAELAAQTDRAAAAGFQLAIHAIGDAANAQVISAFERLGRRYGPNRRWRIEHLQVVDPVDIPRIARAGIIASMQPVHQTSDRTMAETRLDPPRLAGAYAWQTLARSGARLAFGSDFPVEHPNPFPGLAAAISRQDPSGQPPGGWRPEERVTLAQALSGFTRDAAYAGFAEDRIGSLERGKWADFIIVDGDPTKLDAQAIARIGVLETYVAGKLVHSMIPASCCGGERGR